MNLGKQCRIYRAAHDLTQKQLARKLKISQTALSLLESNKPVPQLKPEKLAEITKHTEAL